MSLHSNGPELDKSSEPLNTSKLGAPDTANPRHKTDASQVKNLPARVIDAKRELLRDYAHEVAIQAADATVRLYHKNTAGRLPSRSYIPLRSAICRQFPILVPPAQLQDKWEMLAGPILQLAWQLTAARSGEAIGARWAEIDLSLRNMPPTLPSAAAAFPARPGADRLVPTCLRLHALKHVQRPR